MTDAEFKEFMKRTVTAEPRGRVIGADVDKLIRALVVGLVIVLFTAVAVFTYQNWPREAPQVERVDPFVEMVECVAIDFTGDASPDLLSCPGGQAFSLDPIGGSG